MCRVASHATHGRFGCRVRANTAVMWLHTPLQDPKTLGRPRDNRRTHRACFLGPAFCADIHAVRENGMSVTRQYLLVITKR